MLQERTGQITSDSLAAESLKSGGDFAAGQGAAASGVPSKSTTANTTDTSGATTLKPAADAASRDSSAGTGSTRASTHHDITSGNSKKSSTSTIGSSLGGSSTTGSSSAGSSSLGGVSSSGLAAGGKSSYAGAVGRQGASTDNPKGSNITEGGFDSSAPNASFNNEIGTKNDPGRVAEAKFEADAAQTGAEGGYAGSGEKKLHGGKGGFEHLNPQKEA